METNETILTRDVVIIDSHKKLGSVRALRVDCDTMAVCHYIVNNDSTGSVLVLPFEKALAVGDTFMTVQNRDDFLAANDAFSNKVLQDGYALLKEVVFSRTGNKLGSVSGFEFDTVHGGVKSIILEGGATFSSDAFVFFSTEFVFVDDGAPTAAEIRSRVPEGESTEIVVVADEIAEEEATADEAVEEAESEEAVEEAESDEAVGEEEETADETVEEAESEEAAEMAEAEDTESDDDTTISDDEIVDFLTGKTLLTDVESEDGQFKVASGVELTKDIILEAARHDAILLLTINVEV